MANLKNTQNEYTPPNSARCSTNARKPSIAVSALTCGGDHLDKAALMVAAEWSTLADQNIVPQRPGRVARDLLKKGET